MCGIVYYHSIRGKNVVPKVIKRYSQQKHRGTKGFGFFLPDKDQMAHAKNEDDIIKYLKKQTESKVLFHHRQPTSTDNVRNACHPFSTKDFFERNYVMVHNGHVSNHRELRKEHEAMGIKYVSVQPDDRSNDSEALLWDLALYLEGKQAGLKAYGNYAFILYQQKRGDKSDKPKLYFGRNINPLMMHFSKNQVSIASEATNGAKAIEAQKDTLYMYDYSTGELKTTALTMPTWATQNQQSFPIQTQTPRNTHPIGYNTKDDVDNFIERIEEEYLRRQEEREDEIIEERASETVDYYMSMFNQDPDAAKDAVEQDLDVGKRSGETGIEVIVLERAIELLDSYIDDLMEEFEEAEQKLIDGVTEAVVVDKKEAPALSKLGFVIKSAALAEAIRKGKKEAKS